MCQVGVSSDYLFMNNCVYVTIIFPVALNPPVYVCSAKILYEIISDKFDHRFIGTFIPYLKCSDS